MNWIQPSSRTTATSSGDSSSSSSATFSGTVAGQPLGSRAGGVNSAALALVHAEETEYAPAAIRPDPDTYIRQLLRQYRAPGATIARQIGNIASYRLLLGGATEDFNKQRKILMTQRSSRFTFQF